MVDRETRQQLARALKQLVTGKITNDDYQDLVWNLRNSEDKTVAEIATNTCWGVDDAFHTYRWVGKHACTKRQRRECATMILFLMSDIEYEERPVKKFSWLRLIARVLACFMLVMATVATFGLIIPFLFMIDKFSFWRVERKFRLTGIHDIWPFNRNEDFQIALRRRILGSQKIQNS